MPVIPGHANLPKTRSTKYWEYRNVPSVYLPASANLQEDRTQYYIKTPQEMSRYEIAELEQELRELNEAKEEEEEEETITEAERKEMMKDPAYRRFIEKMKMLQKMRHGVIKRYFDKFKYKRNHRNDIV
mmetsp:Transcript_17586/g.23756  ORF Transcript_17586/g.23756 Transcript_17586/m.23756 type:complete len:129 (-) Transcript_17586:2355-2741(-)